MKHTKIYSSEVIHKDKTLDKVLEEGGGSPVDLPIATESQLGCVTIGGAPLDAPDGDLQLKYDHDFFDTKEGGLTINKASGSQFGVVKIGSGLSVNNGVISVSEGQTSIITLSSTYNEFTREDDSSITGFKRYSKEILSSSSLHTALKNADILHPEYILLDLYNDQAAIRNKIKCSSICENTNGSTKWRSFLFSTNYHSQYANKTEICFYTVYISWT